MSPVQDEHGDFIGTLVTWCIATEQKHLEQRNQDHAAQIAALHKSHAIIEYDMDGTVITANENYLVGKGYAEVKSRAGITVPSLTKPIAIARSTRNSGPSLSGARAW